MDVLPLSECWPGAAPVHAVTPEILGRYSIANAG